MRPEGRETSTINSAASRCLRGEVKERIRDKFKQSGACAVGFAQAGEVEASEWQLFEEWLKRGDNAGMDYMRNYPELRRDPREMFEAKSVISVAFSYKPKEWRDESRGMIAAYAYGKDYHKVIRKLLKEPLREIGEWFRDMRFRVCVDSAPVLERYWAIKAGIGYRGDNGCVIVPGFGSMVFLAEILTDLEIEEDEPLDMDCGHCGACVEACPGKALGETIDCRRCLSYLTIEHKGDWDDPVCGEVLKSEEGRNTLFGCDRCLRVCPHNKVAPPGDIEAFEPLSGVMALDRTVLFRWGEMGEEGEARFKEQLSGSSLLRAGLSGLCRNV
ncbi:MAG: tRNA epoxyqueuosine(34) reductase QueG [Muribaculaceae bacterium]|nr:tRNA epoxyqueuosine(34) reductase QueG [Muribaculaceae bacterium]